jgi:long-subunit fatty acid transport protein
VGGLNFDYGIQYFTNISSKVVLTLGYSGTAEKKINSSASVVTTHYRVITDPITKEETELPAADTLFFTEGARVNITMPLTQSFGFSFQNSRKWLLGADFSMSNWADYREGTTDPGLKNSYTFSGGGQITPNINSSKYLNVIDYRLGFKYDKTYINVNNTDVKQTALTLGFGFPLLSNRNTYYKINFSTEIGSRGTLSNNLVRERFMTFNLGFIVNDKWFQKYKFD